MYAIRSYYVKLDKLVDRATDGVVEEVILATNFTNEGEVTAHTVGELLRARGLKVSRIARGVPVGGELEHTDIGTIAHRITSYNVCYTKLLRMPSSRGCATMRTLCSRSTWPRGVMMRARAIWSPWPSHWGCVSSRLILV